MSSEASRPSFGDIRARRRVAVLTAAEHRWQAAKNAAYDAERGLNELIDSAVPFVCKAATKQRVNIEWKGYKQNAQFSTSVIMGVKAKQILYALNNNKKSIQWQPIRDITLFLSISAAFKFCKPLRWSHLKAAHKAWAKALAKAQHLEKVHQLLVRDPSRIYDPHLEHSGDLSLIEADAERVVDYFIRELK
jgi:hypothetical protein